MDRDSIEMITKFGSLVNYKVRLHKSCVCVCVCVCVRACVCVFIFFHCEDFFRLQDIQDIFERAYKNLLTIETLEQGVKYVQS